jgi:hypothetical protein
MKHKHNLAPFAFLLFIVTAAPVVTRAQSSVAYVKDLNGQWHLNGSAALLSKGKALIAGNRITFTASNIKHSFITIADVSGRPIVYKNCDRGECNQPIIIRAPEAPQPSIATQIFRAVMHLWQTSPARYVSFISRGAGDTLVESVLLLEQDELDLAPALAKLRRGQYLLKFKSRSSQTPPASDPISFVWEPAHPKKLKVKGLTKGIYELQLLDPDTKDKLEPGTEAWVFLTDGANYKEASGLFVQAKAMTSQWGEDTTDETKRSFLRAYLDSLAGAR